MLIELQIQDETTEVIPRSRLRQYAFKVVGLKHQSLGSVYEIGTLEAGFWTLVKHAGTTNWKNLPEVAGELKPPEVSSILFCLADALDYLYRAEFRGGRVLSWNNFLRCGFHPRLGLTVSILPPTPTDIDLLVQGIYCAPSLYSAPELIDGFAPTPSADSFAIASLAFHLITGKPLVQSESVQQMAQQIRERNFLSVRRHVPDFSEEQDRFIQRALKSPPKERPTLRDWVAMLVTHGGQAMPQGAPEESVLELRKPQSVFRFRNVLHDQMVEFSRLVPAKDTPMNTIMISEVEDGKYTLNLHDTAQGLPDYCHLCGGTGRPPEHFCSSCGHPLVTRL